MNLFSEKDIKKLKKQDPNIIDYNDFMKEDKVNIPDIDILIAEINSILEFMNEDDIIKLTRKELEQRVVIKFPDFSTNYFTLMKLLLDGADLGLLFNLLDTLKNVKKNKIDIKDAENSYSKILAKKFIPSEIFNDPKFQNKLNSKDA